MANTVQDQMTRSEAFVSMLDRLGLSEEEFLQADTLSALDPGSWNPEKAGFVQ